MAVKVLIQGYYGFGNFGDDLLLLSAYRIVQRLIPSASITVFTWSPDPAYLKLLIPGVDIKNDVMPASDLIVHGGGGVFFDFENGTRIDVLYNKLISFLSPRVFSSLVNLVRRKSNTRARVGIGLGIGTYTSSSRRLRYEILHLSDFRYLMVRDSGSITNLLKIGITNGHVGTDLVFDFPFSDYGGNLNDAPQNEIALILRDWKYDGSAYLETMLDTALKLRKDGNLVRVYSFDPRADQLCLKKFEGFPQTLWDPKQPEAILHFITALRSSRLVISSRAHGIIVAACLGIPSVGVNIEPKIAAVVNMVPESSTLVSASSSAEVSTAIQTAIFKPPSQEIMKQGIDRNKKLLADSLDKLSNLLNHMF